jgi:hypothetical protein
LEPEPLSRAIEATTVLSSRKVAKTWCNWGEIEVFAIDEPNVCRNLQKSENTLNNKPTATLTFQSNVKTLKPCQKQRTTPM